MVNEYDLLSFFQQDEDIATKLNLRRSPLLFVDYWLMKSPTDFPLKNPPGTSTAYYYIEGKCTGYKIFFEKKNKIIFQMWWSF